MNNLSVFGSALKTFDKFYIGVDHLVKIQEDITKTIGAYPFYNIKKTGDNSYKIELALAGWSKQEIGLELNGDKLVIKGESDDKEDDSDYFFKGISKRSFTRSFMLNNGVEIRGATFVNGVLSIALEHIIAENNKCKKIEIDEFSDSKTRQFLTE